jgi:hypothetical protein
MGFAHDARDRALSAVVSVGGGRGFIVERADALAGATEP